MFRAHAKGSVPTQQGISSRVFAQSRSRAGDLFWKVVLSTVFSVVLSELFKRRD